MIRMLCCFCGGVRLTISVRGATLLKRACLKIFQLTAATAACAALAATAYASDVNGPVNKPAKDTTDSTSLVNATTSKILSSSSGIFSSESSQSQVSKVSTDSAKVSDTTKSSNVPDKTSASESTSPSTADATKATTPTTSQANQKTSDKDAAATSTNASSSTNPDNPLTVANSTSLSLSEQVKNDLITALTSTTAPSSSPLGGTKLIQTYSNSLVSTTTVASRAALIATPLPAVPAQPDKPSLPASTGLLIMQIGQLLSSQTPFIKLLHGFTSTQSAFIMQTHNVLILLSLFVFALVLLSYLVFLKRMGFKNSARSVDVIGSFCYLSRGGLNRAFRFNSSSLLFLPLLENKIYSPFRKEVYQS